MSASYDLEALAQAWPQPATGDQTIGNSQGGNANSVPDPIQVMEQTFQQNIADINRDWTLTQQADFQSRIVRIVASAFEADQPVDQGVVDAFLHEIREALKRAGFRRPTMAQLRDQFRLANAMPSDAMDAAQTATYQSLTDPERGCVGIIRINGSKSQLISNFAVIIHRHVHVRDELETSVHFEGQLLFGHSTMPVCISSADYASGERLIKCLYDRGGPKLRFDCKPQEFRNAISALSQPAVRTETTDFGWNSERSEYLTQSGRITATGFLANTDSNEIRVNLGLEQHARHLDLKPVTPDRLVELKDHLVNDFLRLQEPAVMMTLLATVALAILEPFAQSSGFSRPVLWLTGLTGVGKSFLARLLQAFFGRWPDNADLPGCTSTANYLERQGYYFRNAIFCVDDFKPDHMPPLNIRRMVQAYADSTGRGRLRSDAKALTVRYIRGLLVINGEDIFENSASSLARCVVVAVPQRANDLAVGNRCRNNAHDYNGLTCAFVAWCIRHGIGTQFAERALSFRQDFISQIHGRQNDARIAGNLGLLAAAAERFVAFLAESDASGPPRYPQLGQLFQQFVGHDLIRLRSVSIQDAEQNQDAVVFLRVLGDLIENGEVRVDNYRPQISGGSNDNRPIVGRLVGNFLPGEPRIPANSVIQINLTMSLKEVNNAMNQMTKPPLRTTNKALIAQLRDLQMLVNESGVPVLSGAGCATQTVRIASQPVRTINILARDLLHSVGAEVQR